jgi:hypothetical protein
VVGRACLGLVLVACGGKQIEPDASVDSASDAMARMEDASADADDGNPLPPCKTDFDCPFWPGTPTCQNGRCCLGTLGSDGICRCGAHPGCDLLHAYCCPIRGDMRPDAGCASMVKECGP